MMKLDFLDPTMAKVWGININKPMIIELKFTGPRYLEDRKVTFEIALADSNSLRTLQASTCINLVIPIYQRKDFTILQALD